MCNSIAPTSVSIRQLSTLQRSTITVWRTELSRGSVESCAAFKQTSRCEHTLRTNVLSGEVQSYSCINCTLFPLLLQILTSAVWATFAATTAVWTWWARTAANADWASFLTVSPSSVKVRQRFIAVCLCPDRRNLCTEALRWKHFHRSASFNRSCRV